MHQPMREDEDRGQAMGKRFFAVSGGREPPMALMKKNGTDEKTEKEGWNRTALS